MSAAPERNRRLMLHGMVLFLLGMLTGLVQQKFANPRMGLAAHIEGLLNGTFLLALGAAWNQLRLSTRSMNVAYVGVLYGSYANWAVTTLSAILGTTAMTPIAGAGHRGADWQEGLITAGFVSVGIVMIVVAAILIAGFRARTTSAKQGG